MGKYISMIITIIVLTLFGVYIYNNPEILNTVLNSNPLLVISIMVLYLILFFLEGVFIQSTLKIFNKEIGIKESYYLSTISRIGNYLLPLRAGAVFRATYLKNKYHFEYTKFLSTLYTYYILLFLLNSIFAIFTLLFKYLQEGISYPLVSLFFIGIFISMLILILARKPVQIKGLPKIAEKVFNILSKFITSWDTIVKSKEHFKTLLLLTLGNIVFSGIINYIEFLSMGIKTTFLNIVLYTCLSGVSLLISITPGSIGLREGIFVLTSESIGLSEEQIMQLALLDRGIMFVLLLLLLFGFTLFVKSFKLKDIFIAKG